MLRPFMTALLFISLSNAQFPGPDAVTGPTWTAQPYAGAPAIVYTIKDLGSAARPKVVYNCYKVPALCNNAKNWLEQYNIPINSVVPFHYDYDFRSPNSNANVGARADARRKLSCPTTWMQSGTPGNPRCPERGARPQPDWLSERYPNIHQPFTLYHRKGKVDPVTGVAPWIPDPNGLLGTKEVVADPNGSGGQIVTYKKEGTALTCDEFPPASWVQGGQGATRPARTYCAPKFTKCNKNIRYRLSEQDWQGQAFGGIRTWVERFFSNDGTLQSAGPDTIFRIDFQMVDDASSDSYATWVEANNRKRYCYGPQYQGTTKPGCSLVWADDPASWRGN